MERVPSISTSQILVATALVVVWLANGAFQKPWDRGHPWPSSSTVAVRPLDHPSLEARIEGVERAGRDVAAGYRFAVFGDQRPLAGGEWQALLRRIAEVDAADSLLFVLDTGDIVDNGAHTDQFAMLAEILRPIRHLPYLVAIGNHEVDNNKEVIARQNAVQFLPHLDAEFGTERMYYRKDVGPVTFLFLDSNDFVYGTDGQAGSVLTPPFSGRLAQQWDWLRAELASLDPERTIVVSIHHPFLQTSKKHRGVARELWGFGGPDTPLPELLIESGVDLILVGHTHTYERFQLRRGNREMALVNVSGRPRDGFLWFGSGTRKCKDIEGREAEWLTDHDWDLEGWEIRQEARMDSKESNQFVVFAVDASGALEMQVAFVERSKDAEVRWGDKVKLGRRE